MTYNLSVLFLPLIFVHALDEIIKLSKKGRGRGRGRGGTRGRGRGAGSIQRSEGGGRPVTRRSNRGGRGRGAQVRDQTTLG